MNATITVGELLVVLLSLLGVGVLAYLIVLLMKVNESLKSIQQIVNKNEKHLNETLERIPRVLENVEGITGNVDKSMVHVQTTIENVSEVTDYATDMVKGINEEVVVPLKEVFKLLLMIKSLFGGSKKKKWF
jgi:predicted PurR-regulated permease PerM